MIDRADVLAAQSRIAGRVRSTPVLRTAEAVFKLEYLQLGGTFKIRGSLNTMLSQPELPAEVVIASGGNAAIAAAHAARIVGARCTVVVPETAPAAKVAVLHRLAAEVIRHGERYQHAFDYASAIAVQRSALQLHAYDLPGIVAGAGTVALEIDREVDAAGPVLVAVGGGGLVSGIAAGTGRQVVGVEPQGIPTLHAALAAGAPVDVDVDSVAADSLGATRLGSIAWDVVRARDVGSVLVADDAIVAARSYLWREYRILVELGAAVALAALRTGAYVPPAGQTPVIVLCGANTDPTSVASGA